MRMIIIEKRLSKKWKRKERANNEYEISQGKQTTCIIVKVG